MLSQTKKMLQRKTICHWNGCHNPTNACLFHTFLKAVF